MASTTTGFNGYYLFLNLAPGNYRIRANPPAGLTQTTADLPDVSVGTSDILASPIGFGALPTTALTLTGPSSAHAGAATSFTLSALSGTGHLNGSYGGTVHFTSTDPQAVLPADYTFLPGDAGVKSFTLHFFSAGAQSISVTDTANLVLTTTAQITIGTTQATHLVVSGFPVQAVAGVPGAFTVTALDADNNPATNYTGTLHFSSSDPKAVLPADYTFVASDHGSKSFTSAALETAGLQSITAQDTIATSLSATSQQVTVLPGVGHVLLFEQQPLTGKSGVAFQPAITIKVEDAFGNLATGFTGPILLSLGKTGPGTGIVGTTSVNAVAGIATFSNAVVTGMNLGQSLSGTSSGLVSATSAPFNRVLTSNILPVTVPSEIYGPGPNASQQEAYIKGIYRALLRRNADPAGLAFWLQKLTAGAAHSDLINGFYNSDENRGLEVDTYYQAYLGRHADPGGRTYWIGQLQHGVPETQIVLSFFLSPEALQAPDATFVQRLYSGALGRDAGNSEISYWTGQLQQGATREQVSNAFIFSPEAAGIAVDSFFAAYLGRLPEASARAFLGQEVSSKQATFASIALTVLSSDEFFANAGEFVP